MNVAIEPPDSISNGVKLSTMMKLMTILLASVDREPTP